MSDTAAVERPAELRNLDITSKEVKEIVASQDFWNDESSWKRQKLWSRIAGSLNPVYAQSFHDSDEKPWNNKPSFSEVISTAVTSLEHLEEELLKKDSGEKNLPPLDLAPQKISTEKKSWSDKLRAFAGLASRN